MSDVQIQDQVQEAPMTWSAAVFAGMCDCQRRLTIVNQALKEFQREAKTRIEHRDGIGGENHGRVNMAASRNLLTSTISYYENLLRSGKQFDGRVDDGCLVRISYGDEKRWMFILPADGGRELSSKEYEIPDQLRIISSLCPFGNCLSGKRVGDTFDFKNGKGKFEIAILAIFPPPAPTTKPGPIIN